MARFLVLIVLLVVLVAIGTTTAQAKRTEFELLTLSQNDADGMNDAFRTIVRRYALCSDRKCGWIHLNPEEFSVDVRQSTNAEDVRDRNYILRLYADVNGKHIAFEYVFWPRGGQLCGSMLHFFKQKDGEAGMHVNPLTAAELKGLLPEIITALSLYAYSEAHDD